MWYNVPDNKVHGANMGSTWVLSAPAGPHVGPMKHAIRGMLTEVGLLYWGNVSPKDSHLIVFFMSIICCFRNNTMLTKRPRKAKTRVCYTEHCDEIVSDFEDFSNYKSAGDELSQDEVEGILDYTSSGDERGPDELDSHKKTIRKSNKSLVAITCSKAASMPAEFKQEPPKCVQNSFDANSPFAQSLNVTKPSPEFVAVTWPTSQSVDETLQITEKLNVPTPVHLGASSQSVLRSETLSTSPPMPSEFVEKNLSRDSTSNLKFDITESQQSANVSLTDTVTDATLTHTMRHSDTRRKSHSQHEQCYQCMVCSRQFQRSNELRIHMESHNDKDLKCDECDRYFRGPNRLRRHKACVHKTRYKCSYCRRPFGERYAFLEHLKLHEKDCLCDVCGKTFHDNNRLSIHKRTHSAEKDYKCSLCLCVFRIKGRLLNHVKKHHEDMTWGIRCKECQEIFGTPQSLKSPKKTKHRKPYSQREPRYQCMVCSNRFKSPRALEVHIESHNEKNLKCDECDRYFSGPRVWRVTSSVSIHQNMGHVLNAVIAFEHLGNRIYSVDN